MIAQSIALKFRSPCVAALAAAMLMAAWLPAQAVEFEDCRISAGPGTPAVAAECTTLAVPEDPAAPDGTSIDLAIARVAALSQEPHAEPVVILAGGPGQGARQFFAGSAAIFQAIRREFDLLLVDQRGTGDSNPLNCAALNETDDSILGDDTLDIADATQECLDGLPGDPRFYTTSVAVRDLETVRVTLGYERFNLYGISYGSRVAQHYVRRFPASSRAVVLDGVVPPGLALGPDISLVAQAALDRIFARCAEDAACNRRFPDLADTLPELIARLEDAPIEIELPDPTTGEPREITIGAAQVAIAVRLLSYSPDTSAMLPLLLTQAANADDLRPIAAQALLVQSALASGLAGGMHNAVVCTEDAPYYDLLDIDLGALSRTYLGTTQLDLLKTGCAIWPRGVLDDDLRLPLQSDVPALLLSGGDDPITPPEYADQAATGFSDAVAQTNPGQGHGQITVPCMSGVIADFFAAGTAADLDTRCAENYPPAPFFLSFSGPEP